MIYVIGIGVEGRSSLSQRALVLIEGAGLLFGGKRHLAYFPEFKGQKVAIGSNLEDIAKILSRKSEIKNGLSFLPLGTRIFLVLLIL